RRDACKLPIRTDRECDGGGAREPIVVDVVDLQFTRVAVPQYEIAFAGHAAEVANSRKLPIHAHLADESGAGDLIAVDVCRPGVRRYRSCAAACRWCHGR